MVKIRRWEIPGCQYHVSFPTRHKKKILTGKTATHVAIEIMALEELPDLYLIAWCIMPDHVHMLVQPPEGKISFVLKRVKGRTGKALKPKQPDLDRFWERRYFDRRIRVDKELMETWEYIEMNPVVAGFCDCPESWLWSSAFLREFGREEFDKRSV